MFDPVLIAGFIALFVAVGGLFLAVNLLVGRLVRPQLPNTEKLEVYECGEPTIGSSFVQFDLRFYVVALLFIILTLKSHSSFHGPRFSARRLSYQTQLS